MPGGAHDVAPVVGLRLALLGDSIAHGTGASRTADTLAPRLAAALSRSGIPAATAVFAVPGARSAGLARQVVRATAWRPDVAVVVIGANDLAHRVPAEAAAAALRDAVRGLRAAGAQVVLAPAPDLSVVPHVPAALRDAVRAAALQLRARQTEVTRAEGGRVADSAATSAAAFAADPALFAADRFHPSSAGYAVIADALAPAVLAAARAAVPDAQAG